MTDYLGKTVSAKFEAKYNIMNVFEKEIFRQKEEKLSEHFKLKRQQRLTREFSDTITELIGIEPVGGKYVFKKVIPGYYLSSSSDYTGQNRPDAPGDGKPFWHGWKYQWWGSWDWLTTDKLRSRFLMDLTKVITENPNIWREQDLVQPITQ